ncbi:hypothetical protein ACER0C_014773 [Sarotherodon galilaeus]
MPALAVANKLELADIPAELSDLNILERHLIAKCIPFAKIIPLPKGRQRAIRGNVVCVPSEVQETVEALPRLRINSQVMRVKLKRRLSYKGHQLFQTVSWSKLVQALHKLKQIHPQYKDVSIRDDAELCDPTLPDEDDEEDDDDENMNEDDYDEADLMEIDSCEKNALSEAQNKNEQDTDMLPCDGEQPREQMREPLGKVIDYFYRVEFQHRGSPHIHCLLWVEGAPVFEEDDEQTVVNFINKYITAQLPDPHKQPKLYKKVTEVQKHSKNHTKTCFRSLSSGCRFGFPKPPCNETMITRPSEDDELEVETAKNKLRPLNQLLNEPETASMSLEQLLARCKLTHAEYERYLNKMNTRSTIILKRDPKDSWINGYNPYLLEAWNSNIDISFVLDAFSAANYLMKYISKKEGGLSEYLKTVIENSHKDSVNECDEMRAVMQAYSKKREISAQECVARACGLHMKQCSRAVIFIPTDDNPVKMSRPLSVLDNTTPESSNVWMTSLNDKYKARPETPEFEEMCMADFAATCRIVYGQQTKDHELKTPSLPTYQAFYGAGCVQLPGTDRLEYVQHIVKRNREKYEKNSEEIESAVEEYEQNRGVTDEWCNLAPESDLVRLPLVEQERERDNENEQEDVPDYSRQADASTEVRAIREPPAIDPTLLHARLKQIKGTRRPFGGMSVIAVGDFYQLPPVRQSKPLCVHDPSEIDLWREHFQMITLTEIMRQKDDVVFAEMLNRIRVKGKVVYSENDQHIIKLGLKMDNETSGKNNRTPADDMVYIERAEENLKQKGVVRRQFPVKLAFACTIHKVQGMTTTSAVVSLKSIFEPGMAYVAVSRVTSLNGLYLLNMEEKKIFTNPEITAALENMRQANLDDIMPLLYVEAPVSALIAVVYRPPDYTLRPFLKNLRDTVLCLLQASHVKSNSVKHIAARNCNATDQRGFIIPIFIAVRSERETSHLEHRRNSVISPPSSLSHKQSSSAILLLCCLPHIKHWPDDREDPL